MLTEAEKAAARAWRDAQMQALAARNEAEPPGMALPVFLRHVRHECEGRPGRSVSFHFREVYLPSPAYAVHPDGCVDLIPEPDGMDRVDGTVGTVIVPAGRFAFIYREGACPDCEVIARSRAVIGTGCRLVVAEERPPTGRSQHARATG